MNAFSASPCNLGQSSFLNHFVSSRRLRQQCTVINVAANSSSSAQPIIARTPIARSVQKEKRAVERRSLDQFSVAPFSKTVSPYISTPGLHRRSATTLQINIGLTCNLACHHCHVESSPLRKETMLRSVADRLISLTAADGNITTVDITGGAPEMHAQFRYLVEAFSKQGLQIIDRCNLVVLEEPGQEDLAQFLAEKRVKIVASLPCYSSENVEKQRGDGVFDSSIRCLQKLNSVGYGREGSGLELDLVYNPGGPFLPPPQSDLETDYKRELKRVFGIEFTKLICISNMPIKRFADDLIRSNQMRAYLNLLVSSFNPKTLQSVMCLDMIHVAWDGTLYDCDFNYALAMTMAVDPEKRKGPFKMPDGLTVFDIDSWSSMVHDKIQTGVHCYGCTAGTGSSCGGSLS